MNGMLANCFSQETQLSHISHVGYVVRENASHQRDGKLWRSQRVLMKVFMCCHRAHEITSVKQPHKKYLYTSCAVMLIIILFLCEKGRIIQRYMTITFVRLVMVPVVDDGTLGSFWNAPDDVNTSPRKLSEHASPADHHLS
jgi:hypothetical protein